MLRPAEAGTDSAARLGNHFSGGPAGSDGREPWRMVPPGNFAHQACGRSGDE